MNKKVVLLSIFILVLAGISLVKRVNHQQIESYVGDYCEVANECKHIALIGCTPHPTSYLAANGNNPGCLKNVRIDDFLDLDYVYDSFLRTCRICKEQEVDHLIIAYLPIYFVRMRPVLGNQFVRYCRVFLTSITPDMLKLIDRAAKAVRYTGKVTLIIPPDYQLERVPQEVNGIDERIRYLIKQFPALKNIVQSDLKTITIINNEESAEDDMLISYLKYEYLYEKPLRYRKANTGKKQFHKGKS